MNHNLAYPKGNVYFVQAQDSYDGSVYLPYSSGVLWAYANQHAEVYNRYRLADIIYEKIPIHQHLDRIHNPEWVFFSTYIWNTQYHLKLSASIKSLWPNCKIVFGGPNVQLTQQWFDNHPWIDCVCWGEGENTVTELLSHRAWNDIAGLAFRDNRSVTTTPQRARITDINSIPSPYLTGVFDSMLADDCHEFLAVWETNRGCPYHCTFCDLGNSYYNKLHCYDTARLLAELDWFADKKISWIEITDANFGILERDLELCLYIKKLNSVRGFPRKVNATWAKNSPARVVEMSKVLHDISRGGVTLALQSQDPATLKNIKRINIANSKLVDLIQVYRDNNIPTYHDFILGLPGETLLSWKRGIGQLLDVGTDGWLSVHPLEVYANTEMSDPDYQARHGMIITNTDPFYYFMKIDTDGIRENANYVFATQSMPREHWIEGYLFSWLVSSVYNMGFLQWTLRQISHLQGTSLSVMLEQIESWIKDNDCLMAHERNITKHMIETAINKQAHWGRKIFGDQDIQWLYESATAVQYQKNLDRFYRESTTMLCDLFDIDVELVSHLITEQQKMIVTYADPTETFENFCKRIYWWNRKVKSWHNGYQPPTLQFLQNLKIFGKQEVADYQN